MSKFPHDFLIKSFSNQASLGHRTIFVLIGEGSKDELPNLHDRLSRISPLNGIIWCYKNSETAGNTVLKKSKISEDDSLLMKWIKIHDPEYVIYKESNRILGRTCDMLIMEDFEAVTPNIIASCMETVKGGGIIVLLFNREGTLNDLISTKSEMVDEYSKDKVIPRFNRRLFKTLRNSACTIFLDSKLRVMDLTMVDGWQKLKLPYKDTNLDNLNETPHMSLCKTADQKNVLKECISKLKDIEDYKLILTAPRGRGKSVSMGFAVVEAFQQNLTLINLSALFLENVQTIFEFISVGLNAIGYKKMVDYKITYTFEKKKRLISKIDILKGIKKTVEYISPFDTIKYYPNLLIVDEAASIPLEYLKRLLKVKLVFLSSTISGYEGTGRSFMTKLTDYIEEKKYRHVFIEMLEPIRYSMNDPVENWLNKALILNPKVRAISECPMPNECTLFHVNKDALFCGNKETEQFLDEVFSLFAASHYRNSPNDMQILSDSPNHEVFTLMTTGKSPRIACAIQIAFEGNCDKNDIVKKGNLIPWVIYENFYYEVFLNTIGVRIIRIAVHPGIMGMGYGSASINIFKNNIIKNFKPGIQGYLLSDSNALFQSIEKIFFSKVDWIGVSFGLTEKLLNFWKRLDFMSFSIKQTQSRTTGEFSTVALQLIDNNLIGTFEEMKSAFLTRFIQLLPHSFCGLPPTLVLSLIYGKDNLKAVKPVFLNSDERNRLKMFSKGLLDIANVIDIFNDFCKICFFNNLLSKTPVLNQAILVMLGCQNKSLDFVIHHFDIEYFRIVNLMVGTVDDIISSEEYINLMH